MTIPKWFDMRSWQKWLAVFTAINVMLTPLIIALGFFVDASVHGAVDSAMKPYQQKIEMLNRDHEAYDLFSMQIRGQLE